MSYELLRYGTWFEPYYIGERQVGNEVLQLLRVEVRRGNPFSGDNPRLSVGPIDSYPEFDINSLHNSYGTMAEVALMSPGSAHELDEEARAGEGFASPFGLSTIEDALELAKYERSLIELSGRKENKYGFYYIDYDVREHMSSRLAEVWMNMIDEVIATDSLDYDKLAKIDETIEIIEHSNLELYEGHPVYDRLQPMKRALDAKRQLL